MATAGASALAAPAGVPQLTAPLLVVALIQTVYIATVLCRQWWRKQRPGSCWGWDRRAYPEHPTAYAGLHTVPLGLAVVASGLASVGLGRGQWVAQSGALVGTAVLSAVLLALAWLLSLVLLARFLQSVARHGLRLTETDGSWFLVPASVLGAALATAGVASLLSGPGVPVLHMLALAGDVLGWLGYWGVAAVVLARLKRYGLGGVPQAPWWIAMGCAGLAAAACAGPLQVAVGWPLWVRQGWTVGFGLSAVVGVALSVPVLVGSTVFLLRHCNFRGAAVWPPTFSTAVFALGCLHSADVPGLSSFALIGLWAARATVLFWGVTAAWNIARQGRRAWHSTTV